MALLFSCVSKETQSTTDSSIIDISESLGELKSIDQFLPDSLVFRDFKTVVLQTKEESLLYEIDRIYKDDGYLFVMDSKLNKVCVFDESGTYISHIHNVGLGPEEYVSLMDFCIDISRKELVLLCDVPFKIMRFSYEGVFLSEDKIPNLYQGIIMDSDYVYCCRSDVNDNAEGYDYEFTCFDREMNVVNNAIEMRKDMVNNSFSGGEFFTKNQGICYTRRFDDAIYQIEEGKVYKKYTVDFGKFQLPDNLINEENSTKFFKVCSENDYIYNMTDFVDNENYIIFKTNRCICIYDKRAKTLNGYGTITNSKLMTRNNYFLPFGNVKNSIVTILDPGLVHMLSQSFDNNVFLENLKGKVKEDDNPILVIYEFKDQLQLPDSY